MRHEIVHDYDEELALCKKFVIAHIRTHNNNYTHVYILLFLLTNGLEGTCAHECIYPA